MEEETYSIAGAAQVFPWVPANNPYNLCNEASPNYTDCWGQSKFTRIQYISHLSQVIQVVILSF